MGLLQHGLSHGAAEAAAFSVDYSCRFNDNSSNYLVNSDTGGSEPTDGTVSFWVKRGHLGADQNTNYGQLLFRIESDASGGYPLNQLLFRSTVGSLWSPDDALMWNIYTTGGDSIQMVTTALFRDPSAWYHIMAVHDSSGSTTNDFTASDSKCRLYVNGKQVTAGTSTIAGTNPLTGSNFALPSSGKNWWIGINAANDNMYLDGYLADYHFVPSAVTVASDGSSVFAEADSNGQHVPIEYTGSHGTTGFHLDFADSAALGADASANSNDFTGNNLAVDHQVIDTPSAGKNFCTINPLDVGSSFIFSEGNLYGQHGAGANWESYRTTIPVQALDGGKAYWEYYINSTATGAVDSGNPSSAYHLIGLARASDSLSASYLGASGNGGWSTQGASGSTLFYLYPDEATYTISQTTQDAPDGSFGVDDIWTVAVDASNSSSIKVWFGFAYSGGSVTWILPPSGDGGSGAGNPATGNRPSLTITSSPGDLFPAISHYLSGTGSVTGYWNFGADHTFAGSETALVTPYTPDDGPGEFYYDVPAGFKALCTANLAAPGVNNAVDAEKAFEVITYEGNAAETAIPNAGTSPTTMPFNADLIWGKNRSNSVGYHHGIADSVRGISSSSTPILKSSSSTGDIDTSAQIEGVSGNQITLGDNSDSNNYFNLDNDDYVIWAWKANGSTSPSANTDAGFSIVKWTGDGGDDQSTGGGQEQDITHGLSVAPEMIIAKSRTNNCNTEIIPDQDFGTSGMNNYSNRWLTYHKDAGGASGTPSFLALNETWTVSATDSGMLGAPIFDVGASEFTVNNGDDNAGGGFGMGHFYWLNFGESVMNGYTGDTYIAYCFASIDGYSKVGSFVGDWSSSALGSSPFVYLGFKPRFVLLKNASASASWIIHDTAREPYNVMNEVLFPDGSWAEYGPLNGDSTAVNQIDVLSNGFKLRNSAAQPAVNGDGNTMLYIAFAEIPFQFASAR